jgi:hypothetical protein
MLVGGIVVHHQVQLPVRIGAREVSEEGQELLVAVPVLAQPSDLAGGDLQRGEQCGGAVPDVVVGALLVLSRQLSAEFQHVLKPRRIVRTELYEGPVASAAASEAVEDDAVLLGGVTMRLDIALWRLPHLWRLALSIVARRLGR